MGFNIAIDGPAGAGKSTIARLAAEKLGFLYVDTGAMYRTIGLKMLRSHVSPEDTQTLQEVLKTINIDLRYEDGKQQMYLDGENVSSEIRTEEVSTVASRFSAIQIVRDRLTDLQRGLAARNNCIMDGRDIGTVILPNARLKIFLTASAEERARRRYRENMQKGIEEPYETVLEKIIERDRSDMTRSAAPLKQADDAVLLDTSDLSIEQSVDAVLDLAHERMHEGMD